MVIITDCGVDGAINCRELAERQFSLAPTFTNVAENHQTDYVRFNAMEKLMQARSSG